MNKRQETSASIKLRGNQTNPNFTKSEEIVQYLYENVLLQNKMQFYSSLDLSSLEDLLSVSFRHNKFNQQKKLFVIQLLKKHTYIISMAFNHENFNFYSLISFINDNRLDYSLLNLLEDILLPFCRKFPQKVLSILTKDKKIRQTFTKHIYIKHIFKILYTIVFCCQKNFIQLYQSILSQIMNCMINSIFQYITYPTTTKNSLKLLQFGQITQNFKVFLFDLCNNLVSVEFILIEQFITLLFSLNFIENSFDVFDKYKQDENLQQYCQGIILIHIHILKLEETLILSSQETFNNQQKQHKKQIQNLLFTYTSQFEDRLQYLIDVCVNMKTRMINYSTGENIEAVGLIRYRILELIQKLLNLSQITSLKIKYDQLIFIPLFQHFLMKFKWNNLVQTLLLKIFQTIICQDRNHFILKHLNQMQNFSNSFFGHLIVNFRNKKFLFLHSLRMTYQGNRSILFLLCKIVISQIQEKSDLNILFKKMPFWKQFIEKDMKSYQQRHYEQSKCFNCHLQANSSEKRITRKQSIDIYKTSKSLQTIEKILLNLKQEDQWSPNELKQKNFKKIKILENELFKQMDSLVHLQKRQ